MKTTYYHGRHAGNDYSSSSAAHEGMCLTLDLDAARQYAGRGGIVYAVEIDSSLSVVDVDGYDRDSNEAPADRDSFRAECAANGADLVRYTDEDERGRQHICYRIVSHKVAAQCTMVAI